MPRVCGIGNQARQRLCLRGTTDYWVNAMDGQPFFAVTQAADPGLLQTLEEQIVPRLLAEVPNQPTEAELAADRWRARFTLAFDRAGYSPQFMERRWEQRIAVITYHKFPEGSWPVEVFTARQVRLVNGQEEELLLAERGYDGVTVFGFGRCGSWSLRDIRWPCWPAITGEIWTEWRWPCSRGGARKTSFNTWADTWVIDHGPGQRKRSQPRRLLPPGRP